MFGFGQSFNSDAPKSDLLECVVQRNGLFESVVEWSLYAHVLRNTEESGIEYLFNLRYGWPVNFRLSHRHEGVKSNIDGPINVSINVQHIKSSHNPSEAAGTVMISLYIIDMIVFPFIAVAFYVHVSLPFTCLHFRPEVRSIDLLFVVILSQKVTELGVFIVIVSDFRQLYRNCQHPLLWFNFKAYPFYFIF